MSYASYQGKLHLAKIVAGIPQALRWVGNVPEFNVSTDSDVFEHYESSTGQRTKDYVKTKTKSVSITATFEDYSRENLALAVSGSIHQIASKTVANAALPTLKVGDEYKLDGFNISALVIEDSTAGTPVSLVENTHYTLDANRGKIKILSVVGLMQPLIADYTTGAVEATTIMSSDDDEYYLYFEGVNTANNNEQVNLELWRMKKQSKGEVPFIHEELGKISITGDALSDVTKTADGELGLYGRVVHLPAV